MRLRRDSEFISIGDGRTTTVGELRASQEPVMLKNGVVVPAGKVYSISEAFLAWQGTTKTSNDSFLRLCKELHENGSTSVSLKELHLANVIGLSLTNVLGEGTGGELDREALAVIHAFIDDSEAELSTHGHPIGDDDDDNGGDDQIDPPPSDETTLDDSTDPSVAPDNVKFTEERFGALNSVRNAERLDPDQPGSPSALDGFYS